METCVWQDPKCLLKDENNLGGGQGGAGMVVYRERELHGLPQIFAHGSLARSSTLWPGLLFACSWKRRQRAAERGLTFQTSGGRVQGFHPENTVMQQQQQESGAGRHSSRVGAKNYRLSSRVAHHLQGRNQLLMRHFNF